MRAHPRERFSSEVTLSPATVVDFANAAGDNNPMHHDPEFAATTRFGRPTASGPHTTALLLALTASHFSKTGAMLGLEFWVRFRRPIYTDETILLEWMVVKVTPNEKLKGEIVELRGRIKGQDGETSLGARGRVLLTDGL
jgi:3-hydroxybutyryl-CoA dehydratase